jgi:CheY-like chemotaxis protein
MDRNLPSEVVGDVTRLRQILVNLLSNAIKFTEKGEVVVSVSGQLNDNFEYKLYFCVRDTGIGILPEKQNKLFASFNQIDSSTTRNFGGTGLGLAISKKLCELMEGKMWMESSGINGKGSAFHFIISTKLSREKRIPNDMSALKGKRVLTVDDNQTNREILIKHAYSLNMNPTGKASGQEALQFLSQGNEFDLAILDYQIPYMDGVMLAEKIRLLNSAKKMPLILLSSYTLKEKQNHISDFAAVLTKPTKLAHLHNALITLLMNKSVGFKKQEQFEIKFDTEIGKKYPLRTLLAEDNIVNQKVALRFLEKVGYKADVAFNGIEVLNALKLQNYDVILIDIQMPELDGEQTTIEIRRQLPKDLQPRIIAMTANAWKKDHERYLLNGMDDFLIKPFKMENLIRVLIDSYAITSPQEFEKVN